MVLTESSGWQQKWVTGVAAVMGDRSGSSSGRQKWLAPVVVDSSAAVVVDKSGSSSDSGGWHLRPCALAPLRPCALAPMRSCTLAPLRPCALAPLHPCALAPLLLIGSQRGGEAEGLSVEKIRATGETNSAANAGWSECRLGRS